MPLEKAKRLEPAKASIREALGIAYFRIRRFAEAEAEFRAILELSPTDHYAHYALGRTLEQQGRDGRGLNGHYKLASARCSRRSSDATPPAFARPITSDVLEHAVLCSVSSPRLQ